MQSRYFYHYLFWAIVLLSYWADAAALLHFNAHLFWGSLVLKNGLLIGVVYFQLRVLIPVFWCRKRYGAYAAGVLLLLLFGSMVVHHVEMFAWAGFYGNPEAATSFFSAKFLTDVLTVCRYLVISALLKFIDDSFEQRERLRQVQQEKTIAELNALKARVNPHFLFNTLNNLYGLVLERSDLAAETVLKLSDILKYTLTEGDAPEVPLRKDLENLRHYFDLECLRLPAGAALDFQVEGALENRQIAPLLLLPLLENAFKHGVHRCRERHFLQVKIRVDGALLHVEMVNSLPGNLPAAASSLGTGLQNLRKRLELIYPGRHQLETARKGSYFHVTLELRLIA